MNKTAIITGASKGIGAATAILFAHSGYNVVINYNDSYESATLLARSLKENGANVIPFKANVANRLEVDMMIKEAIYNFGTVDVLVNNAGVAHQGLFTDISEYDWDRIVNINLKGVFNYSQAVLPEMINKKSGKIINVSSMWGITGASCEVAYSASKAGVIGLTKALAKELAPSGITVNCVAPGVIETNMNSELSVEDLNSLVEETPLGRIGSADEVAKSIYFLASPAADFITGEVLNINGGYVI